MAEPMEEGAGVVQIVEQSQEASKPKVSSILRPGSMVMMTITEADYMGHYWPKLEGAIHQLLTMPPRAYIPISYEQMYSCVYKCVCKQFSERLYSDLLQKISCHLDQVSMEVQTQDSQTYIENFHFALTQYLQALSGIVPIFNYMNRFYIETKLKTDLNVELRKLFVRHVAEKHVPILIPLLVEANTKPFFVSPPIMANLISSLYSLEPDFAKLRPHLFAKYIPNILPPCSETELTNYIEEARQMQRDLRTHPDFISGDQSRKRPGDEELPRSMMFGFLQKDGGS